MKTIESVRSDEVEKTIIKISTRQDDGGDVDDLDSGDVNDMEVSYDCDLNLFSNFEPTSFEDVVSHDEGKEPM
jgi:hypothetical protein